MLGDELRRLVFRCLCFVALCGSAAGCGDDAGSDGTDPSDASPGIDSSSAEDSSLAPDGDAKDAPSDGDAEDASTTDTSPADTGNGDTGTDAAGSDAGGSDAGGGDSGGGDAASDGGCPSGQKLCAGSCVTIGPENGCEASSCEPCMFQLASALCKAGACGIAQCDVPNFNDWNNILADGCEGTCYPGDDSHCKIWGGTGTASCTVNYLCACEGTECLWGERCKTTGSTFVCSCNGGAACSAGQHCCPSGGCVDQTSDAMNCGGCGMKCGTGKSCVAGVCL